MPEFFLELFSEEIPARLQARAADELSRVITDALAPLRPSGLRTFFGPRRIALVAQVEAGTPEAKIAERGPRVAAPEQALAGFLRKHGAARDDVRQEGDYWLLEKSAPAVSADALIADALPAILWRFSWPKSMRWGGTSSFTWVRPLRRIVCLLNGAVVPFDLRDGADDGHGLVSGNLTEGHRFHDPGEILVRGFSDWREKLAAARVIVDAEERKERIADGISQLAAARGLRVVEDAGLLDEVAGLVEWPVPLLGKIDAAFMDLPPEVMQVSMRVNQRYFALRNEDGSAAPYFAFVANVEATDGGVTIIAGNERVLRARFADARHFWDLDRKARLEALVPKLDHIVFHAKLGSQGERVRRLEILAAHIAPLVGCGAELARRAALLCKADLVTGMVGEFPELQGVMGGYYARHDGEDSLVAEAIRDHYAPRGPADTAPSEPVSVSVALADKLDQLVCFFAIGEKPTGSGDPYALRRAALGIIRIIRENDLDLNLGFLLTTAAKPLHHKPDTTEVGDFIVDRLRIALRSEGARHDILDAVFWAESDDNLRRLLRKTGAIGNFLTTPNGISLLAAHRRATNILRIEAQKDGASPSEPPSHALFRQPEEIRLSEAIDYARSSIQGRLGVEDYASAMTAMAILREPLDAFFENVTVNAKESELRRNRLALLLRLRRIMDAVADFARIEG